MQRFWCLQWESKAPRAKSKALRAMRQAAKGFPYLSALIRLAALLSSLLLFAPGSLPFARSRRVRAFGQCPLS